MRLSGKLVWLTTFNRKIAALKAFNQKQSDVHGL